MKRWLVLSFIVGLVWASSCKAASPWRVVRVRSPWAVVRVQPNPWANVQPAQPEQATTPEVRNDSGCANGQCGAPSTKRRSTFGWRLFR